MKYMPNECNHVSIAGMERLLVKHGAHGARSSIILFIIINYIIINKDFSRFAR